MNKYASHQADKAVFWLLFWAGLLMLSILCGCCAALFGG